jgi:hypothetical protein
MVNLFSTFIHQPIHVFQFEFEPASLGFYVVLPKVGFWSRCRPRYFFSVLIWIGTLLMFTREQRTFLVECWMLNVIWVDLIGFTLIFHLVNQFCTRLRWWWWWWWWWWCSLSEALAGSVSEDSMAVSSANVAICVCRPLLAHQQYKSSRVRARWHSLVALQPLWGDYQMGCRQFWLGSIVLLDMILGQGRVGQAIFILACIVDLRARPWRWPAVRQEKLKYTLF